MLKERPFVQQRNHETKRLRKKVPIPDRYYIIDLLDIRKPIAWKFDYHDTETAWKRVSQFFPSDENYFDVWSGKKLHRFLKTGAIKFYRVRVKKTPQLYDYDTDNPIEKEKLRERTRRKIRNEKLNKKKQQLRKKAERARRRKNQ